MKKQLYDRYKKLIDMMLGSNIKALRKLAAVAVYDKTFYDEPNTRKKLSANHVADIIVDNLEFESVFDIGCGIGMFICEIRRRGKEVLGCDYSEAAIANACEGISVFQADVTETISVGRKFDLVLCFEVAEHIAEKFSDQLVDNCVRHSDSILFTAAPPGQGGVGHINEQPYSYWQNKFAARGFVYNEEVSVKLKNTMREQNVVSWIADNIMYFNKQ